MNELLLRIRYRLKAFALRMLYFKNEQALLRGTFTPANDRPSVVFLTVHKAASSLLSVRLTGFFRKHGYAIADLSSYFAKTGLQRRERFIASAAQREKVFRARGVFHCAFRWVFEVPRDADVRILLVLRDPRDVLVSHYFSTLYSHPVINPEFYRRKQLAQRLGIDAYVLAIAEEFRERYEDYLRMMQERSVLFLRYEDLVADPASFELRIAAYVDLSLTPGEIVSPADFVQEQEQPHSHKRKVTPGDHRDKLSADTIERLDAVFGQVLQQLGYGSR